MLFFKNSHRSAVEENFGSEMWDQMKELCPDVTKLTEVIGPSIIPMLVSTWSELLNADYDSTLNMMTNSPEKIADFLRERVEAKTGKKLLPSSAPPHTSDNKSTVVVASQLPGNQGMIPPMMGAGGGPPPPMMGGKGGNMPNAMNTGPPLLGGAGAPNLPGMGMGLSVPRGTLNLPMMDMGAPSLMPGSMMGMGAAPPSGGLPMNNPPGQMMGMNPMALPGMGGLPGQMDFSQMEAALQNRINALQQQQAATAPGGMAGGGGMTTGAPGNKGSVKGGTGFPKAVVRWNDFLVKDTAGGPAGTTGGPSAVLGKQHQSGATGPPIPIKPLESVSNSMFSATAVLPRPTSESAAMQVQTGSLLPPSQMGPPPPLGGAAPNAPSGPPPPAPTGLADRGTAGPMAATGPPPPPTAGQGLAGAGAPPSGNPFFNNPAFGKTGGFAMTMPTKVNTPPKPPLPERRPKGGRGRSDSRSRGRGRSDSRSPVGRGNIKAGGRKGKAGKSSPGPGKKGGGGNPNLAPLGGLMGKAPGQKLQTGGRARKVFMFRTFFHQSERTTRTAATLETRTCS